MVGVPRISEYNRSCRNCKHFDFDPDRPKLNRECMYKVNGEKAPITVKRGTCQMWKDTRTLMQRLRGWKIMKANC